MEFFFPVSNSETVGFLTHPSVKFLNILEFGLHLYDTYFCLFLSDNKTFMEKFQEVAESQQPKEENKEASATAGLLEKLTVEEKKTEENDGKEKEASEKAVEEDKKKDDA